MLLKEDDTTCEGKYHVLRLIGGEAMSRVWPAVGSAVALLAVVALTVVGLLACAGAPDGSNSSTAPGAAQMSATATLRPTETPAATDTPAAETATLTPTNEPSSTPTLFPSPTEPVPSGIFLELVLTDTAWIQVTVDGVHGFEGELPAGTYRSWSGEERIELSIGDAGAVLVTVNGEKLGALGDRKEGVDRIFERADGQVGYVVVTPTPSPSATPTVTLVPIVKPTAKPTAKAAFGYGIQAHMLGNGQAGTVMDNVKELGFGWVKQQVVWRSIEPSKGQYDFGQLDTIALEAKARGVSVLWSVVNAPAWARSGQDLSVNGPPNDPQDSADFFGALAGHFCGSRVKAIEVWDGQNLQFDWGNKAVSPADYMALLKPTYQAIKAACPSMIVVSGGLTPTGAPAPIAMDDEQYLQGMYDNGLKNNTDAIGAHASGYNIPPDVKGGQPACDWLRANKPSSQFMGPCSSLNHSWSFNSTLNDYYNLMKQNSDSKKKIWVTEFGWAAGGAGAAGYEFANDNTMSDQATYTVRAYRLMKQWGVVGAAFLWNLNFSVLSPGSELAQWSIVYADWSPTETYAALKAMAK